MAAASTTSAAILHLSSSPFTGGSNRRCHRRPRRQGIVSASAASSDQQKQLQLSTTTSESPVPATTMLPSAIRPSTSTSAPNYAAAAAATPARELQIRKIPGDYGLPFLGAIRDRHDYFYKQGRDDFFRTRIQRHGGSTVLRLNMPPGPFIAPDPRVIALLDGASFPVLFDVDRVEKRDLFTGTFMPSTDLTGGYRMLSYLDPSEPNHAPLKQLLFYVLMSRRDHVIPEFRAVYGAMFDDIEEQIAKGSPGKADFGAFNDVAAFTFLSRALFGVDPAGTGLGKEAPGLIMKWVLFQLGPLVSLGLPPFLDNLLLRVAPLPGFLVKDDYKRLYNFFEMAAKPALDQAEKMGLSREEACHNILFSICFNSFGGFKILFPSILKWVAGAGAQAHSRLATEVRSAVRANGGEVTMKALQEMPLVQSAVYEAMRMEPPVPMQYGRAKRDIVVESHDAAYEVKKGEMLFGYQPFATRDPRIFERADQYVADRFLGEEGARLVKHVIWSNGPETEKSTIANKQCAGKDFVGLVARLLLVELFLRYDSLDVELGTFALGTSVSITSLKKATS